MTEKLTEHRWKVSTRAVRITSSFIIQGPRGPPHRARHNSLLRPQGTLCRGPGEVSRPWGGTEKGKEILLRLQDWVHPWSLKVRDWFSIRISTFLFLTRDERIGPKREWQIDKSQVVNKNKI